MIKCINEILKLNGGETMANPYIKSPISYTGGKYKLLPQMLPLFPQREFRVFWENFSGGCNIAQNIKAK